MRMILRKTPLKVYSNLKVAFLCQRNLWVSANLSRGIRSPFRVSRKIEKVKNYSRLLSNIVFVIQTICHTLNLLIHRRYNDVS